MGNTLVMDPVIPPEWNGFDIKYRFGDAIYLIQINNPENRTTGVKRIELDGQLLSGLSIPLVEDGREHRVTITMGKKRTETNLHKLAGKI
jgi:cellobiose phosphorylase